MTGTHFISLLLGGLAALSPVAALAQVNPWIVSPQTIERSGNHAFPESSYSPERAYRYDQTANGYADTPIWGSRQRPQTRRRASMPERRPLYGPFANERWTGTAAARQTGQTATRQLETSALSSMQRQGRSQRQGRLQRQGRFVPSYATGHFGTRQPRRASPFQHYPPSGYNPSAPQFRARPNRQMQWSPAQRARVQRYPAQRYPGQRPPVRMQARSWPYRAPLPAATNTVQYPRPTWQSGRSRQLTPTWQPGRSRQLPSYRASTPPWAVNPAQNGSSQGFAGPSTFGNPFGSPFGGLSGPFGNSGALALPLGGMW